jgi:hypothetical protein
MPQLIPIDRQVRMRWRNGRGETREVAAWPAGSTLETFEWRVSVATVTEDGAFSRFPGVTRTLALIGGAGLRLTGEATRIELAHRYAAASYRGDDEVHCKLVGGVVQVLNVMVRGDWSAHVTAVERSTRTIAPARYRACLAIEGAVECDAFALRPGDALLVDDARESTVPLRVSAVAGGAVVVAIDARGSA